MIMDIEDCETSQDAVCFVHLYNHGVTFRDYGDFDAYLITELDGDCDNCKYKNDCPLIKYYES